MDAPQAPPIRKRRLLFAASLQAGLGIGPKT
jgi:hypothetical protein